MNEQTVPTVHSVPGWAWSMPIPNQFPPVLIPPGLSISLAPVTHYVPSIRSLMSNPSLCPNRSLLLLTTFTTSAHSTPGLYPTML